MHDRFWQHNDYFTSIIFVAPEDGSTMVIDVTVVVLAAAAVEDSVIGESTMAAGKYAREDHAKHGPCLYMLGKTLLACL